MATPTMIETVTVTRPLKPGEFARRMLGQQPSPVLPTRSLWPPLQQPLSISTLQLAYLDEQPAPRRAATLPPQTFTTINPEYVVTELKPRSGVCTVGTNTDPPLTLLRRLRALLKRQNRSNDKPASGKLTTLARETAVDRRDDENAANKALNGIRKAISTAKYKITPGAETVDSPKIVYDMSKPGDHMVTTFGSRDRRPWYKLPSRKDCSRHVRTIGAWCRRRPRRPPRRQSNDPRLQITQV